MLATPAMFATNATSAQPLLTAVAMFGSDEEWYPGLLSGRPEA
jgi:hypothetical protein